MVQCSECGCELTVEFLEHALYGARAAAAAHADVEFVVVARHVGGGGFVMEGTLSQSAGRGVDVVIIV